MLPESFCVVDEIEDKRVVLQWMSAIEARECLHRLAARKDFVHIHCVEEWLVVAGLKFIRHDEKTVWVFLNQFLDLRAGKPFIAASSIGLPPTSCSPE